MMERITFWNESPSDTATLISVRYHVAQVTGDKPGNGSDHVTT